MFIFTLTIEENMKTESDEVNACYRGVSLLRNNETCQVLADTDTSSLYNDDKSKEKNNIYKGSAQGRPTVLHCPQVTEVCGRSPELQHTSTAAACYSTRGGFLRHETDEPSNHQQPAATVLGYVYKSRTH